MLSKLKSLILFPSLWKRKNWNICCCMRGVKVRLKNCKDIVHLFLLDWEKSWFVYQFVSQFVNLCWMFLSYLMFASVPHYLYISLQLKPIPYCSKFFQTEDVDEKKENFSHVPQVVKDKLINTKNKNKCSRQHSIASEILLFF